MTTDLVRSGIERSNGTARDWVALMAPAVELAKQVADTSFVPQGFRNDPPAIVAAILYGDEVGLGPMQALSKIAVINGRPTLAAEAQRALILAAGHDMWIVEANNTRVTVAGRRSNSDQVSRVTWTLDDAKRAGLSGKQNWRLYPRQMLLARATAELARLVFADAIGGLVATEEIEEPVDFDAEAAGESAPTTRRKRRTPVAQQSETSAQPPAFENVPAQPLLPGEEDLDDSALRELEEIETQRTDPPDADDIPFGEPPPVIPGQEALPEAEAEPGKSQKPTKRQADKLNVLVGQLRDAGHLTTEQLWHALANSRNIDPDQMAELLSGRDHEGMLHWAPLRDSLTRAEASSLIDRLERYEQHLSAAEAHE